MAAKKPKTKRSGPTTVSQTSTPNGQPTVHEPVKKDDAASMFWIFGIHLCKTVIPPYSVEPSYMLF